MERSTCNNLCEGMRKFCQPKGSTDNRCMRIWINKVWKLYMSCMYISVCATDRQIHSSQKPVCKASDARYTYRSAAYSRRMYVLFPTMRY